MKNIFYVLLALGAVQAAQACGLCAAQSGEGAYAGSTVSSGVTTSPGAEVVTGQTQPAYRGTGSEQVGSEYTEHPYAEAGGEYHEGHMHHKHHHEGSMHHVAHEGADYAEGEGKYAAEWAEAGRDYAEGEGTYAEGSDMTGTTRGRYRRQGRRGARHEARHVRREARHERRAGTVEGGESTEGVGYADWMGGQ